MVDSDKTRCSGCQAALPPASRFCPACGKDVASLDDTALAATAMASARERNPPNPSLPPMRLPPGTLLSVYRIESVLGEGGMGVVYRAVDEARDRVVAVKCLHTNLAGDLEIRRRFIREARVLRSWTHPNVVAIYDFVEHEHFLAIVMEYVEGPSLVRHLDTWRGRVPFEEIRALFGGHHVHHDRRVPRHVPLRLVPRRRVTLWHLRPGRQRLGMVRGLRRQALL
jgi:serine/threonine-protein kinase